MDEEKIKELRKKRLQLKQEVTRKARIPSQIAHLEKIGQSFNIYDQFENLNWIDTNVKVRNRDGYRGIHGDFQIDVDNSKVPNNLKIKESEIDSDKFSDIFKSIIPIHSSLIVCYQGGCPELEISDKAFLSKPTIFLSHPETWLITTDKNWIIEYLWDQGVIRFIKLQNFIPTLIDEITIEEE
jgi:hypothetical protein